MKTKVKILKRHLYASQWREPGDPDYEVEGQSHLQLFLALGRVERAAEQSAPPVAAPAPAQAKRGQYATRHIAAAEVQPAMQHTPETVIPAAVAAQVPPPKEGQTVVVESHEADKAYIESPPGGALVAHGVARAVSDGIVDRTAVALARAGKKDEKAPARRKVDEDDGKPKGSTS